MLIKARINEDQVFRLCSWSASEFDASPMLRIQTDDLRMVKDVFSHINKIEIFMNDTPAGTYMQYDSYESISYEGQVFVQHENIFADCMRVGLKRSSLADEVARIAEQVSPTIDIDAMTVDEYRSYLLGQISKQCSADIYEGTQVQLADGTVEKYTYDDNDQKNLTNAMAILIIAPECPAVPYHPSGGFCRMIPAIDLLNIYGTLQLRLTYLVTRCNYMTMWIRSIQTKEELMQITWNTELPEEYQAQVANIYSQALAIMEKVREKFIPAEEPTDDEDKPINIEPQGDGEDSDPNEESTDENV